MTLPSSGAISLSQVNTELNLSSTALISLNDSAVRTLFAKPSGAISMSDGYGKSNTPPGQVAYTSPGTYTWVCPAGVTSVSVLCVGGGGGGSWYYEGYQGGGGALAYGNNIAVTPGASYTVYVGPGGAGGTEDVSKTRGDNGSSSYFVGYSTLYAGGGGGWGQSGVGGAGGGSSLSGGGQGGQGGNQPGLGRWGGAGGASGYTGNGGRGGEAGIDPTSPAGGGGGGSWAYGRGGGVGLLGQGASGAVGTSADPYTTYFGGGGSGGGSGNASGLGLYGAGGGSGGWFNYHASADGAPGAVRIIWPGNTRQFPSTNTGNL